MTGSSVTVTSTKISPPRPPSRYLSRARLIDALEASVQSGRSVVLVSAPAGSGKSTLVNGWLDGRGGASGWLQIDEGDDDPSRFWSGVAATLDDDVPGLGDAVRAATSDGLDAVVTTVVNEVAGIEVSIVLVVDDYHLVTNPDVHRSVEQLVERLPRNLVLVVSTRVDPPFRLGRLRVRDQLTEVRADDLRFDLDEARWLLDADIVGLGNVAVDRLLQRTEGWAAGLVLAALSLRKSADVDAFVDSFHGDDQLVADYLADEFLETLLDDRDRLLDASVLERMSGPLIDELTGGDDGARWLQSIAASNQLVISLDRNGTWFRFHHLLRDMLRLEAQRTAPERVAELHRIAGDWHDRAGSADEAIEHLLQAGESERAADLIAANATRLLNRGQTFTVTRLLDRLGDTAQHHGGAATVWGWICFVTGRFAEAKTWLERARPLDTDEDDTGLIEALAIMVHTADGDITSALRAAENGPPAVHPTHAMVLGGVRALAGLFDEAAPLLDTARELAEARPDYFALAVNPLYQAIAEIEQGRTTRAHELATNALAFADTHRFHNAAHMALGHSVLARTCDDRATALEAASRGVELARRSPEKIMLAYALAAAADAGLEHGGPSADDHLSEARSIVATCVDPGVAGTYLGRVEARHGLAERPAANADLVEELSDRELSVLRFLPSGLSQREIAGELYVSLNTVKTHCKAIYRKLGVDGRQAAVQVARERGLT
ncbi:LuxR C-terminal-related transcriptional regulator [Ilumatobacter nonamiensis]|uniref:LuxR C-terminal-related transcriptional regulator n=1 Tax=Ilumatobacter nonamiensis TaxID=467093 RepID=UPI0011D18941|nr:LuxR C-terminal-related transcriptional regulator [Ilumatobacter nonamiensis]